MSLQVISEDAYGAYVFSKDKVGTRYMQFNVRTLADPQDPADLKAANALQDAIKVEQASVGNFEVPNWDKPTQDKARDAIIALGHLGGTNNHFGKKGDRSGQLPIRRGGRPRRQSTLSGQANS
jgi:hypothetical protein